jgi:hypothetical protein
MAVSIPMLSPRTTNRKHTIFAEFVKEKLRKVDVEGRLSCADN